MATDIMQPLRYVIDLQSGLVQQQMRGQLMKGDKKANRVIVELKDGGNKADLTGVTATGSFIRPPDAAEIPLAGSVDGNSAIIVLDDACYAQDGYCEIAVKLKVGDVSRTILSVTGYVLSKGSGAYVNVSGVIPSLDDVIEQYAEMKRVTQEAQEAANKANNAASHAPYIGENKNWFIWDATAGKYVDSGVSAKGVKGDPGTIENVTITSINGLTEELDALKENIGDEWTAGKTYAVGDYCISGNRLYKCKTAHTAGSTFDAAYWQATNVSKELTPIYSRVLVGTTDSDGDLMTSFSISDWMVVGAHCLRGYGDGTYASFFTAVPSGVSSNSGCSFKVVSDTMTALKNTKVAIQAFLIRTKNVENV